MYLKVSMLQMDIFNYASTSLEMQNMQVVQDVIVKFESEDSLSKWRFTRLLNGHIDTTQLCWLVSLEWLSIF
jgi:hypothetical protein